MGDVRTHRDLDVWKEGIELAVKVYEIVQKFPNEEKYGLVDQIKRSAISIPSNIAEGAARNSKREFLQFLHISLGSISELETQLIIANRRACAPETEPLSRPFSANVLGTNPSFTRYSMGDR